MEKFVLDAKSGKLPLHTRSCPIPEPRKMTKHITGEQFESVVLKGNQDHGKLILVTHTKNSKNMGVESSVEEIAKQEIQDLVVGKYSSLNECEKYAITHKLPTILYFPKG